jgi:DNA-binding winged helix-turn-helix (wHTH) protein
MSNPNTLYPNKGPVKILKALTRAYPEAVPTRDLIDELWGNDPDGGPLDPFSRIDKSVRRLRDLGYNIVSKPRHGYRLGEAS